MGCRKNQATLTPAEKAAFVAAVLALKAAPSVAGTASRYDDFVQEHIDSMTGGNVWAHQRPAFLPWHREYLRRYELALQEHDPNVTLPYWDWTVDNSAASSIWDADFMGGDGTGADSRVEIGAFAHASGNWDLTLGPGPVYLQREFGQRSGAGSLPTPTQVDNCLDQTPYDASPWNTTVAASFRNRLEGWTGAGSIHNRVHLWVGGAMLHESSPNDPVFWLHHCNVDRLWAQWQREHPAQVYHPQGVAGDTGPAGHNLNDSMQPWGGTTTVASTLDHHAMGFWYDTDPPEVTLTTPSVSFADVPEGIGGTGRTTYRAIVFEVRSCAPVTLEIIAGPSGGFATTLLGTTVVVPSAHGDAPAIGRLWIAYTSTHPGDMAAGSVTVAHVGTAEQWVVSLSANTIARPRAAVTLALDRSGSMSMDAGDGTTKVDKLKEAVEVFVDTMLEGDGLGIVSYDDVVDRLLDVTDVGPMPPVAGSGRAEAAAILAGPALDPRGLTGIGAALVEAQDALDDAQAVAMPPYDVQAIVVLSDGIENVAPMIAAVAPGIGASTYAIGLGLPSGISTAALDALAEGTGNYLLVTGALSDDQRFRLSKFFLQILAGIGNVQIVLDPVGHLPFGPTHRIPFDIGLADYGMDAILTSPLAPAIDCRLEAPDGTIIDSSLPASAGAFVGRRGESYYRLPLPLGGPGKGLHAGRWHALLRLDEARLKKLLSANDRDRDREKLLRELRRGTAAYNFLVHAYSTLTFDAAAQGSPLVPGESATVTATLSEYGVPMDRRAQVWVDITSPNGAQSRVMLGEVEPGVFSGSVRAPLPGLYGLRCRARGHTLSGKPFTREKALSIAALRVREPAPGGVLIDWLDERDERLCKLLACVAGHGKGDLLGIDPEVLQKCLREYCRPRRRPQEKPRARPAPVAAGGLASIVRLVEPPPRPSLPPDPHLHPADGRPMFDLSPTDKRAERAADRAAPAKTRARPQRRTR